MTPLFIDVDCAQEIKHNQYVCGDAFRSYRLIDQGRLISVLSDGLGSGIKANILATMTSAMTIKFMAEGSRILRSAEIMMDSLPVCKVRKISYATFSIVDCSRNGNVHIVEEGNPEFLLVRDGKCLKVEKEIHSSEKFSNRHLNFYDFKILPDDRIIICSDGVTQSGLGREEYKLGWRRKGLIEFVSSVLSKDNSIPSRVLAQKIVDKSKEIDNGLAKDDISAAVIHLRNPRSTIVFTGPPYYKNRDAEYVHIFNNFEGKKIVCGGTTANIIARDLNKAIRPQPLKEAGKLPPISYIDGIDLVTEGIITITKAIDYLEDGDLKQNDAAGKLISIFLDSDYIEFFVGAKLNEAHYDPDLPVEIELRKNVVKRLKNILQNKYMKEVSLKFI